MIAVSFALLVVAQDPVGLLYDPVTLEHDTGEGFPERPARVEAIAARLKPLGLVAIPPRSAEREWLETIHDPEYIDRVLKACEAGERTIDTPDMPISKRSYEAALRATGGVLSACDAVMEGRVKAAFCAVRPPGHHALRDRAMGFCLFNNVAIAARYLQKKHGVGKVLIVDWDVHHGNGTQEAFWSDGTVMLFDTHLHPFYPGTGKASERGEGKGEGLIVNVPLERGTGDEVFIDLYRNRLKPAALAFKPDFVLVSCGFDSHKDDRLGRLGLTARGYSEMTKVVKEIAGATAKGRIVSVLEGGYTLEAIAESAEAHARALQGVP